MGYIAHSLLVAFTKKGVSQTAVEKSKKELIEYGKENNSSFINSLIQGPFPWGEDYEFFAMLPDGSKEGWDDSNKCDDARNSLIEFLKAIPSSYASVFYGGDLGMDLEISEPEEPYRLESSKHDLQIAEPIFKIQTWMCDLDDTKKPIPPTNLSLGTALLFSPLVINGYKSQLAIGTDELPLISDKIVGGLDSVSISLNTLTRK